MAQQSRHVFIAVLLTALLLASGAQAQDARSSLAALQTLGQRAQSIRLSIADSPVVVVVPDERAFARAIEKWTLKVRHPVLIDDGTPRAQERIGRFVRAYGPDSVVRWSPAGGDEAEGVRAMYERALARSWESEDFEGLKNIWKESGFSPLGAVVVSEDDPSWVAGLALAAGRGQLTVWSDGTPGRVGGMMTPEDLEALDNEILAALESSGRAWRGIGDEIETVTLCLNRPSRYRENNEPMAVTDRIGRFGPGKRYAHAGMVFGDASESAYRAMCALFLQPQSAWLFDGYDASFAPPYAVSIAAPVLQENAWRTTAISPPANTPESWRRSTRTGVDAGFVHVNSSGRFDRFDVGKRSLFGHDVPALERPSIVHFIHSFSAQRLGAPGSIASRWLDNGAYVYVGSMHEPLLSAFVPADRLVRRMFASMPLGGAVRSEAKPTVWKVNYFGDPLMVIGPDAPRADAGVALDGAVSIEAEMRAALKERDLSAAATALVMLGRDNDAVRLAKAALAQAKEAATEGERPKIDPALARATIDSAYRSGDDALYLDLCETLVESSGMDERETDRLWRVIGLRLNSTDRERLVRHLSENIRGASVVDDARILAPAVARLFSRARARTMIDELAVDLKDEGDRDELRRLSRRYRSP